MPTIHGNIAQDGIRQSGGTITIEREGKWSSALTYVCRRSDLSNALGQYGTVGGAHPDFAFMTADSVEVEYLEGGLAQFSVTYAGTEEEGPTQATYQLNVTLSEEPLLSHPVYSSLDPTEQEALRNIAAGKETDSEANPYIDSVTSPGGLALANRLLRGQTSYLVPRLSWRQSYVSTTEVGSGDVSYVGKVDQPPGPVPELAGSANWLLNAVTSSLEGSVWSIEKEWLASDAEGWDPDLYT